MDLFSSTGAASLTAAHDRQAERWLGLLGRLVDQNSFSENAEGIDAVRRMLVPEFEAAGCVVEEIARPSAGGARSRPAHLVARRRAEGAPRVLLIAHLDTVHPPGAGRTRMERRGDLLLGPGVGDIKGGVVAILAALDLLRETGHAAAADITVFANSDEEVGSHASRELLRELCASCDLALGFEPAFCPPGESVEAPSRVQHVVQRKGCGRLELRLTGVAAHSGGAHHLGVSAVEALARKVIDMHALTDDARGITTNVGLVTGGRSANTVAPEARAEVDFRYQTWDDGLATWEKLKSIALRPENVNARLGTPVTAEIEPGGGALWPPLLPTPESRRLSDLVLAASTVHGVVAEPITRGGASDAAHAAAAGLPAICGLGPVASGIHTDDERSSVSGLRRSALIAATLLSRLGDFKQGIAS